MPRTVFFDVNETLSDTAPLAAVFDSIGVSSADPSGWLAATLRDGFALSLTTGGQPFPDVAQQTLAALLTAEETLTCTVEDGIDEVMATFTSLPVHDDVADAVRELKSGGARLFALSNGTSEYAEALLQRAGVADAFDGFLSVDAVGVWKPDRRTYEHALTSTATAADDATLVAAHPWDLHGARAAGFSTVHVDRDGSPWPDVFHQPDTRVHSLNGLHL